ncbi:Inner membrane protein YkgB [Streptomyces malaysiensis subsp. malaysiensis]|nr:Inner membrane protein YkgB [Streptomyces sp. M56]
MRMRSMVGQVLENTGFPTIRYGLALNLLSIGRLKFESYEVENIRPLVTASPLFSRLLTELGEQKLARVIGATEMITGSLIAVRPFAPRASALGSLGAAGIFATTLSFLATTPEAWQEKRREPKLSLAGQFLVKDIVLLGASLLTAAESLQAGRRTQSTTR